MRVADLAKQIGVPYKDIAFNFDYIRAPMKVVSTDQEAEIRSFFKSLEKLKKATKTDELKPLPAVDPVRMKESIRIMSVKSPYWKYRNRI